MRFNKHPDYEGKHAFLGASKSTWMRWNDETLEQRYYSQYSTQQGTAIHELAADLIFTRMRLRKTDTRLIDYVMYKNFIPKGAYDSERVLLNTLPFVNDCIGFRMESEVVLYYSPTCFGTTDAIGFNEKELILRISDLKNGVTPAKIDQLIIYAALFCLEYKIDPFKLKGIELRVYQNIETLLYLSEPGEIKEAMTMIVNSDAKVRQIMERNFI